MIGYLEGIVNWYKDNKVIVDVNGVGYLVEVIDPGMIAEPEERMKLYIYTYVREDALNLFGFKKMEERELFVTLLGVSGIGPKAGLNILSSLPYERLVNAILTENVAVLKEVPGIGPKTAQRLILELKNKVSDLAVTPGISKTQTRHNQELYDAMLALGYTIREVENAIAGVELPEDAGIEDKIKAVLSYLGKGR